METGELEVSRSYTGPTKTGKTRTLTCRRPPWRPCGHSDPALLVKTYSHRTDDADRAAAADSRPSSAPSLLIGC